MRTAPRRKEISFSFLIRCYVQSAQKIPLLKKKLGGGLYLQKDLFMIEYTYKNLFSVFLFLAFNFQSSTFNVYRYLAVGSDIIGDYLLCNQSFYFRLQESLKRSCAVERVI